MRSTAPRPPADLGPDGQKYWNDVLAEFSLEPHHLQLLHSAAGQLDAAAEGRALILAEGQFVSVRGRTVEHAACAAVRAAVKTFSRLQRELNLDIEPSEDNYRPPTLPKYGPGAR